MYANDIETMINYLRQKINYYIIIPCFFFVIHICTTENSYMDKCAIEFEKLLLLIITIINN